MQEKQEVIKHSAAIHIQNNITLLQRRAWNVLLANAYDDLPNEKVKRHRIREKDLARALEFDSKNDTYLREALDALVGCKVRWNVLEKDKEVEWGSTTLLAGVRFRNGTCEYAYSTFLRDELYNPRMYARLNLSMQNRFDSKHAQMLWELCTDYLDPARSCGETPFIPLSTYRDMMGIEPHEYPEFKEFNRRVIKGPMEEINGVTDFNVTVAYQREKRKVVAIKFRVEQEIQLPGPVIKQGALFPDLNDMPPIVKELKEAGLSADDAWQIWQQEFEIVAPAKRPEDVSFETYIHEKIDLLKRRKANGGLKSSTGFLLKAIRENYNNAEFTEAEQKKVKANTRKQLAKEKEKIEEKRAIETHTAAVRLIQGTPSVLDEAIVALLETDNGFQKLYNAKKSPAENYKKALLAPHIDAYLEKQHPEHFQAIRTTHNARLGERDAQLASK